MPLDPRVILKTYFESGDTPTESQFVNFIDSATGPGLDPGLDLVLHYGPTIDAHSLSLTPGSAGFLQSDGGQSILLQAGDIVDGLLDPGEVFASTLGVGATSSLPGQSGFLGMSFELVDQGGTSNTHYGFLEFSIFGSAAPDPYAIELIGFAYETTPDTPITLTAIPEPTTALLLMVGLALAALFGRRRSTRA